MKKAEQITLTISLFILSSNYANAQSSNISNKSVFAVQAAKVAACIELRKLKQELKRSTPATFGFFEGRTFAPKISLDLLDGKGIHLFTISEIQALPVINVGAHFNAGIIMTL